jgi:lipopolysaccharide/colanic/teichoic acid biosynthesis glycosyltransferase/glycosyltransferase involved in cell wall biosynthesis
MGKRVLDVCGASFALLVALPLLLVVAVAIKLDSRGPVFFTQLRAGRHGRPFRLYKFRSMVVGSESGPVITGKTDPRTTRVGRLIRPVRIDELPQLVNVLAGDMSLVGPRPEAPEVVASYTAEQRQVLEVRPGITGPTQIAWAGESEQFPPGVDPARYYVGTILPEKLRSDLRYIRTRTLARDLGYLVMTPVRLAGLALSGLVGSTRATGESAPLPAGPRLLFVTYSFPPAKATGAVRVWNIAKYLARRGWAITVLTLDPALWRNVEDAEAAEADLGREGIRRLPTGHRWRWLAADHVSCSNAGLAWALGGVCRQVAWHLNIEKSVGWIHAAKRAAAHLRAGDVDVVLASGPPFSAFTLARRLADRLGCPYVLDYRDLWSRNLYGEVRAAVRMEAPVIAASAAVTIVSPAWGSVLEEQFGVGSKLNVISSGYDAEELAGIKPHDFGHFAIVYTGRLAPPKRAIAPVLAALRVLDEAGRREWTLHYYGRDGRHVLQEAERFGVARRVIVHGTVPRAEALSAVKGAGVAVVITSVAERAAAVDRGMVTAKLFEAIGLGTPILLIAPAGADACAVAEITGLARGFTATDTGGIASFLRDVMDGQLPEPKDPTAYAWENLVAGFDRVLRKAAGLPDGTVGR